MNFPEVAQSIAFFVVFLHSALAHLCQKKSQWGFALQHSHYSSFSAKDYPECLYHCLRDPVQCRSLTYDLMSKTCKLNSKTHSSNPSGYVRKSNSIYNEMLGRSVASASNRSTDQASSAPPTTSQASSAPPTRSQAIFAPPTTSQASSAPPTTSQASSAPPTANQASSTGGTTTSVDTFCVNKAEGLYDHPSDCTKYIKCKGSAQGINEDCSSKPSYITGVCGGC